MLLFTAKFFWYIFTFQIYKGKIIQKLRFQGTSPGQKVIISVSFYPAFIGLLNRTDSPVPLRHTFLEVGLTSSGLDSILIS